MSKKIMNMEDIMNSVVGESNEVIAETEFNLLDTVIGEPDEEKVEDDNDDFNLLDTVVDETFFEMAMIAYGKDLNISVNQETKHLSIAYFKIYDHQKYSAAGRVARLHFKDNGMEYHDDSRGKKIWELNADDSRKVVELMQAPNDEHEGYTNWQVACYQWNYNNGLVRSFKDYFAGKYDHMYDNDTKLEKAYVPHDQEMPEGWIYDKSKGKGHK